MNDRNLTQDIRGCANSESQPVNSDLMVELARVVAIPAKQLRKTDANVLWVETLVTSSCGSCSAKASCGHSILARWFGRKRQCIPVSCRTGEASLLSVGQWVEVGVPENILLRASLLAYIFPLLGILLGAIAFSQFQLFGPNTGEASAIFGAAIGLFGGVLFARYSSQRVISSNHLPRLIRSVPAPHN